MTEPTRPEIDLDALEALERAATKAPWNCFGDRLRYDGHKDLMAAPGDMACWIVRPEDAIFTVRARNAFPDLLRLARRAQEAEARGYQRGVADEHNRLVNHPETADFARGVVLEAHHQRERWDDSWKKDFDWHAVATYLGAKALLNPPQNDGTTGEVARLHRIVALGALAANWHAAVSSRILAAEKESKTP